MDSRQKCIIEISDRHSVSIQISWLGLGAKKPDRDIPSAHQLEFWLNQILDCETYLIVKRKTKQKQ